MPWTRSLHQLLQQQDLSTQDGIAAALAAQGLVVSQGSISRELRRIGARKISGVYRLPRAQVRAPIHRITTTANDCLAVLITDSAFASVLAQRIDRARMPGVLGTLAGDDTVFVALEGPLGLAALRNLLSLPPHEE